MKSFIGTIPERIVFGAGAVNELSKHIAGLGKKALIVTGKSVRPEKTALLERIKAQLNDAGIKSAVFDEVEENPTTITCERGSSFCREQNCDIVVGVGGGSPMDAAKIIAMLSVNEGRNADYLPGGKFFGKPDSELKCLPIVLITTTSGTGSETTPFAVVTNPENGQKPGTGHDFWYAKVAIVDPELMLSMPAKVTINTGLDVFFHAYEAYVSKAANEFADIFAKRAMELVIQNLKKCVDTPDDIEVRSALALANSLAGTAISISGTYAIHGLGHSVGGHYNSAHGASLCAIAPSVTTFAYSGNIQKFADVALLLGGGPSKSKGDLAAECASLIASFLDRFGMNITLSSLGVKKEDICMLVDDAFIAMEGAMNSTPVPINKEDAKKILEQSM
jgi:alcohol dehydrogenase